VSSVVRFRWSQERQRTNHRTAVTWAIDNVYIGMQCEAHCSGHGTCIGGMFCLCDDGYTGHHCTSDTRKPNFLKEDFEGRLDFIFEAQVCFIFNKNLIYFVQQFVLNDVFRQQNCLYRTKVACI